MKRLSIALIAIMWFGIASPLGYAPEAAADSPGTAPVAKEASSPAAETPGPGREDNRLPIHKQDEWQFFLSPYVWITGINANVSTLKHTTTTAIPWWDVAADLFSNAIGVMGRAEAWKGRWGVYLDGYYTYVGATGSQVGAGTEKTFGPVDFTLNKQINLGRLTLSVPIPGSIAGNITLIPSGSVKYISRLGNLDLGARFLVGTWPLAAQKPMPVLSVELLGGPRFNSINQYVRINLSQIRIGNVPVDIHKFSLVAKHQSIQNGSLVINYTNQYFEPFLGARLGFWMSPKVTIYLRGDVGGFGLVADDHVDCNLELLFGYRVSKHTYAWLGYRAHGAWYNLGETLAQIDFSGWAHGPVVGTTFTF